LIIHFLYLTSFTLFEQTFGYFSIIRLHLDSRESSYLLVLFGIIYSLVQGSGMKKLIKRTKNETKLFEMSVMILIICFGLYPLIGSVKYYILLLVPFGASSGITNTLISSIVSPEVGNTSIGGAFGLLASIGSLTRIIAPSIAGFMIDRIGVNAPYILSCFISISILFFFKLKLKKE